MVNYDPLQFGTFVVLAILVLAEIVSIFFPRFAGREHRIAVAIVALVALIYIGISLGFVHPLSIPR